MNSFLCANYIKTTSNILYLKDEKDNSKLDTFQDWTYNVSVKIRNAVSCQETTGN